jgi:leucyl aminopeptidase
MKFQPKAEKGAVRVRFVDGSLTKFVENSGQEEIRLGTELAVGQVPHTMTRRTLVLLLRKAVSTAKQYKQRSLLIEWDEMRALVSETDPRHGLSDLELGELAGTAFEMANYEHTTYKQSPKEGFASVQAVTIEHISKDGQAGVVRGLQIAEEVNACRELSNTPGADMTPKVLAAAAKKAVAGTKATVNVLGVKEMEKLGMGAVLGIGKGSADEPQFIVMEFWGARDPRVKLSVKKAIVFVGKGVTFDTGGLNLKPGDHMYEMHMDMSGGAAVIHAVALIAKLKLKANVIGLIPAVENMAGAGAVRPGDILKSLSGKTIEVLNTDAEGRVILADGITYAKRYNPQAVIDVATLTGASLVAIGTQASLFMTNDDTKIPEILDIAEDSGDYMWPLPAWEEYEAMVKGTFGDVPNLSTDGSSRDGGVIAGGMFLLQFAKEIKDCLWIHVDMAPRMTARPDEFLAKGAAGAPVRFLLKFVENAVK